VGPSAGLDGCGKSRPHRDSIAGPSSMTVIDTNSLSLHYFQIRAYREHCVLRLERPGDDSSIFNAVLIVRFILNTNFGENGELFLSHVVITRLKSVKLHVAERGAVLARFHCKSSLRFDSRAYLLQSTLSTGS
jgi:hypothetical protein